MNFLDTILDSVIAPLTSASDLTVDIKSQLSPNIHLDITSIIKPEVPTTNAESALAKYLLLLAKPEIKIHGLGSYRTITPWGRPTKNYFPVVIILGILIALLNFYVGYKVGKAN